MWQELIRALFENNPISDATQLLSPMHVSNDVGKTRTGTPSSNQLFNKTYVCNLFVGRYDFNVVTGNKWINK